MPESKKDKPILSSKDDEIISLNSKIKQTAHDLNNIITSSKNSVLALKQSIKHNIETQKYLTNIETNCIRATEILEELLASEGIGQRTKRRININDLINDVLRTLKGTISKNISLQVKTSKTLFKIDGFYSDLYRALLNISINAFESIEHKGRIVISAKNKKNKSNSSVVEIIISDNGCGIRKIDLKTIFNEGYSTKNKKLTSGLGLYIVKKIVEDHDGSITIKSKVGKGTETIVTLPAVNFVSKTKQNKKIKKILIAEDEAPILESISYLLESYGYKTLCATNGSSALKKYNANKDIDLIIMDKLMPDMDGLDVIQKIRETSETVPIFLTTGIQDADELDCEKFSITRLVKKPYDFDLMIDLIRGGTV